MAEVLAPPQARQGTTERNPMAPRLASMARSGRYVAIRQPGAVAVIDALGTAPRVEHPVAELHDFACVGDALWIAEGGELRRVALEGGAEAEPRVRLPDAPGRFTPAQARDGRSAAWASAGGRWLLHQLDDEVRIHDIAGESAGADLVVPLGGRRFLTVAGRTASVRDAGREEVVGATLPTGGSAAAGAGLFGNRALVVLMRARSAEAFVVVRMDGSFIHQVKIPPTRCSAIADIRGLALASTLEGRLIAVDLRYGRILAEAAAPMPITELGIDSDGKYLMLAGFDDADELAVLHIPYTDIFGGSRNLARRPGPESSAAEPEAVIRPTEVAADNPPRVDAAAGGGELPAEDEEVSTPAREPEPVVIPALPLRALSPLEPLPRQRSTSTAAAYASERDHLEALLDVVAARALYAIADGWDSGRISLPTDSTRPFEKEVTALSGARIGVAKRQVDAARERLRTTQEPIQRRAEASRARGMRLPMLELSLEFGLSPIAAEVLLVAVAPTLRGEIARLFGILANDENRPLCDRHLIELVLSSDDPARRAAVAAELTDEAPLARHGLLHIDHVSPDLYLFASVRPDAAVVDRLRGNPFSGTGSDAVTQIRRADRELAGLAMSDPLKRDIVLALTRPPTDGGHVRLVIRGRSGSGRRTLLAALAERAGKPLAVIYADRLPQAPGVFGAGLRAELRRAVIRGALPCVAGLEDIDSTATEVLDQARVALRTHPGPVAIRTSPERFLPLDPGYLDFKIEPLSEGERVKFWTESLSRHGLPPAGAESLAARYRLGPGLIEQIVTQVEGRLAVEPERAGETPALLDAAARQHIDTRMTKVATHITRLPKWEQVALPDDVLDSLREFVGRIKHRRTVYEAWGFDQKMTTSRGLTALFYGPPGTGKSMVAGLIARELGLDLYRIDLARIMSKWIGETEKNLAEVFDAAEDGQSVILFDEADSLFSKRTEVKSSVDRYANLEVNYLLQRLDTFEGVAILTTNLEGSVDEAFKRRLSLRLMFPFPDEDMRVRLWATHIPPELPTAGDFDFEHLARRYPMSGGYIRNSCVRAAFLAAQEGAAMGQDHLIRAIHLEYREMGKLSTSGKLV